MRAALQVLRRAPRLRHESTAAAQKTVDDAFLASLEALVTTSQSPDVRKLHGDDESHHAAVPPEVVAFPESTEEVAAILKLCNEQSIAVVPYGAGTSLEGHIQASRGGVCVDVSKLDQMVAEHPEDLDCRVQAGMTRKAVNSALRHTGLHFPVDPGADATIGGMAACGASGTTSVRYGTMRENVLGLTAVLADGTVLETGSRARKSSAGYDVTKLFLGSEGTLGVITEVALRLHPVPMCVEAATARFDSLEEAADAVQALLLHGVSVARCELLDATAIDAFNALSKRNEESCPSLFLEFNGPTSEAVAAHTELALELCADCGGRDIRRSQDETERDELWKARHELYYASCALKTNGRAIVTDACVPVSQLPGLIQATSRDVKENNVVGPCFGHAGDGNFHCILVYNDDDDEDYLERLKQVNANLIERTLAAGGTCTGGERGVGSEKGLVGAVDLAAIDTVTLDPSCASTPAGRRPGQGADWRPWRQMPATATFVLSRLQAAGPLLPPTLLRFFFVTIYYRYQLARAPAASGNQSPPRLRLLRLLGRGLVPTQTVLRRARVALEALDAREPDRVLDRDLCFFFIIHTHPRADAQEVVDT